MEETQKADVVKQQLRRNKAAKGSTTARDSEPNASGERSVGENGSKSTSKVSKVRRITSRKDLTESSSSSKQQPSAEPTAQNVSGYGEQSGGKQTRNKKGKKVGPASGSPEANTSLQKLPKGLASKSPARVVFVREGALPTGSDMDTWNELILSSLKQHGEVELIGVDPYIAETVSLMLQVWNDGVASCKSLDTLTMEAPDGTPKSCLKAGLVEIERKSVNNPPQSPQSTSLSAPGPPIPTPHRLPSPTTLVRSPAVPVTRPAWGQTITANAGGGWSAIASSQRSRPPPQTPADKPTNFARAGR
ncbi:hypothetical protein BJ742DRAFT_817355 [Cladochytrium replicatum]|nr:hypothetical protein BJ742DRAFT_817355 [Cladochytrium replicatum]